MNQATSLFYTAEYEESKILFKLLLKTYLKNNDTHGALRCYYRLAYLTYTRGDMEQFRTFADKYHLLFTSFLAKDIEHYIEQNMLLGLQAITNLKHSLAIPFFAAVVEQSTTNFKKHKISALLFMQKCHITLGNFEQAEALDAQLCEYLDAMENDTQQILHLHLNRAYLAILQGDLATFESYISRTKKHNDYELLQKEAVFVAILEAKHQALQGNFAKSIKRLKGELSLHEPIEDPQILYLIYTAFIEYYEQTKNHKEALHYAKLLMALVREV